MGVKWWCVSEVFYFGDLRGRAFASRTSLVLERQRCVVRGREVTMPCDMSNQIRPYLTPTTFPDDFAFRLHRTDAPLSPEEACYAGVEFPVEDVAIAASANRGGDVF